MLFESPHTRGGRTALHTGSPGAVVAITDYGKRARFVAGLAVCRDEADSDHYDIAWALLVESTRDAILQADTGPRF
jgi:hypothetical protein